VADGSTLGVDNGGADEGGDARPLIIGVLGHSADALPDPLYLLRCMLAQRELEGRSGSMGKGSKQTRKEKIEGNLDFREIHKHTANTAFIRHRLLKSTKDR
jgi:hypothetical protein